MKHVKQLKNECSLAVLSMLSGAKYSTVQRAAEYNFPFATGTGYVPDQVATLFAEFGVDYHEESEHDIAPTQNLANLDLSGRGYFLYRPIMTGGPGWHIVAFENGVIYDSEEYRPYTQAYWVQKFASPFGRIEDRRVIIRYLEK